MSFRYVLNRFLQLLPTALGAVTLTFVIIRLAPGDPIGTMFSQAGQAIHPEAIQALKAYYGLDKPLYYQYITYVVNIFRGDLGVSIYSNVPVLSIVLSQFGSTLILAISGLAFAVVFGIPLGVVSAIRRNSTLDYTIMMGAVAGISVPSFVLGLLMIYFLGFKWPLFPMFGAGGSGLSAVHALILPSIAVGARSLALLARMSRSSMLEVLGQDYIRTARAKGLTEFAVVYGHAIRNAAISMVTVIGMDFGYLLGGAVTVELVFSRPGLGRLMLSGISARDYPVVQGCIIVFALAVIVVNVLTDLAYAAVDPRITYD